MQLANIKKKAVQKFDNLVKTVTNRAIPIAKREAAKVMKSSSSKIVDQAIKGVYSTAVVVTLLGVYLNQPQAVGVVDVLDKAQTININIENLNIYTK